MRPRRAYPDQSFLTEALTINAQSILSINMAFSNLDIGIPLLHGGDPTKPPPPLRPVAGTRSRPVSHFMNHDVSIMANAPIPYNER